MNPLPNDEIAVWKIEVLKHVSEEKRLLGLLSKEEQERASHFVTPLLTTRYTIAQGLLRLILARYVPQKPEEITYRFGPYKKPYLRDNPTNIHFNLTHSNDFALIAISHDDEVGIDIEKLDRKTIDNNMATSILTAGELEEFGRMSREQKLEAFFAAWTHKESLLKLIGTGLYKEMKELHVPLHALQEPHPVAVDGKTLYLQSFYLASDYIASIASPKKAFKLHIENLE